MTVHHVHIIRTADGNSSAAFAPTYGARGISLTLCGSEGPRHLLFTRPDFWTTTRDAGGLPFLFPACGRHMLDGKLGYYRMDGEERHMPLHGFSLRRAWKVIDSASDRIVMSLSDDKESRAMYPFRFDVTLDYVISSNALTCRHRYENRGDTDLPFYSGFHPYFLSDRLDEARWTVDGAFKRIGRYDSTLAHVEEWSGVASPIDAVSAARIQSVIEYDASHSVNILCNGKPSVTVRCGVDDGAYAMKYLQFYRSNQDPFVCVEPWMSVPNGFNDLARIPRLPPGKVCNAVFEIAVS